MSEFVKEDGKCYRVVYSRYITLKNGRKVYPKHARAFRIKVEVDCSSCK